MSGYELIEVVAKILGIIVADPCGVGVVDEGGLVTGKDFVAAGGFLFIYVVINFISFSTKIDDVIIVGRTVGEDLH